MLCDHFTAYNIIRLVDKNTQELKVNYIMSVQCSSSCASQSNAKYTNQCLKHSKLSPKDIVTTTQSRYIEFIVSAKKQSQLVMNVTGTLLSLLLCQSLVLGDGTSPKQQDHVCTLWKYYDNTTNECQCGSNLDNIIRCSKNEDIYILR